MTYEENKAQLEGWLGEVNRYRRPKGEWFRFKDGPGAHGAVVLCTAAHSYHLAFSHTYLGCTASCRTQRPGERWTRGSDLHDGPFSRDTFDAIIRDIFAYELVELAPETQPAAVPADTAVGPSL